MKKIFLFAGYCFLIFTSMATNAQLYWRTDGIGGTITSATWGTSALGPFTNPWIDNSDIFFTAPTGSSITNVTNTPVGNISVSGSSTVTWTTAGTFSTNGNIRTVDVGTGSIFIWNGQAVSTAAGTGFIKNGGGLWNIAAQTNAYPGGFTLNAGTILISDDNSLGAGALTINSGTIQSFGDLNMAPTSISIGGDFENTGSGNATWGMNVSLGSATRSILNNTTSGTRRYTGIISGGPGAGLTFNGSSSAPVFIGNTANTFSGPITINGGEEAFTNEGSFGSSSSVTIDGGRLSIGTYDATGANGASNATIGPGVTFYVGNQPGTSISILKATGVAVMNGVITDKPSLTGNLTKQGAGILTISSICTYSGTTAINNGTIMLQNGNNRLPITTAMTIGQAANVNLGALDMNGWSQEIAGLSSIAGLNATLSKNTITSAGAATLTVRGAGNFGQGTAANSGVITGAVSLVKAGAGTLVLGDANTYSGGTTVSGGTLQLNRAGGTTIASTSNVTVNGGTLEISSDQAVNNLTVSSGTLLVDAGITLTINGNFSGGGTITNNGNIIITAVNNFPGTTSIVTPGFNNLRIDAAVNMDNSLAINGTLTLNATFAIGSYTLTLNGSVIAGTPTNLSSTVSSSLVLGGSSSGIFIPSSIANLANLTINNSQGVSLNSILIIYNSLQLTAGTLMISAGNKLDLFGASLTSIAGYIAGTSTSDLAVRGTTGGIVVLPVSGNISLRNISVSDTRTLALNGINNISLSGVLAITVSATFDNGGESQLTNNGGSIVITGRFITRDVQGFYGVNAAIPGIAPTLNAGCTIEYGLSGDQAVQGSTVSYQNVTFSGSGIKTLASTTSPAGTVYITGTAIVQTNGNNFGNAVTKLTMDGGRLILTTTGTQPAMQGTYTLTAGVVEFNGSSAQTIRNRTYQNIEVTGIGVGNSSGNITLRNNGTFIVTSTGIFTINDNTIIGITPATGTQTVTVQNGGLFRCGNNQGFNGYAATVSNNSSVHANITNINLAAGSTVEYMRSGDQPITNVSGLQYQHLVLSGTGNKIAPSGTLIVNGNLSKTTASVFVHSNGTVSISGTAVQTYTSVAPVMLFYNLSVNNTVGFSVASDMSIYAELSFAANAKLNLQSGYISLKSDATNTADVGKIPSTASITYQSNTGFIAERYIASGSLHTKSWQFLAVPVNNSQTVKASWQEGSLTPNDNLKPGYGTQITSNITGATGLGFDVYTPGGPSMKTYNSGTGSWDGIANTNSLPVYNAKGYMVFIRGDRSVINFSGPNSTAIPTTLRAAGKIFAPGSNPPAPVTVLPGKFESVGNPYASKIDLTVLSTLVTGDVQNIYYVWDPQLTSGPNSAYGLGGYRTLSYNGVDYDVTPSGGSYGATTKYIQSGQAFFVKSFLTGGSVNFDETCKTSGSSLVTRPGNNNMQSKFRTNIRVMLNHTPVLIDGVMLNISNLSVDDPGKNNATKINQSGENMSIFQSGSKFSVQSRNLFNHSDTIEYRLERLKQQVYELEFIPENINQHDLTAYLDDQFLHTQTDISLYDTTRVLFQPDINTPLSFAADRFRVVFTKTPPPPPFSFLNITARRDQDNTSSVKWEVKNENGLTRYETERSIDGNNFYPVGNTTPSQPGSNTYQFIDSTVGKQITYYRVKASWPGGTNVFSKICRLDALSNLSIVSIYPNPVVKKNIQLHFINPEKGIYQVRIMNSSGMLIWNDQFNISGPVTKTINARGYPSGVYQVVITDHRKDMTILQAIIGN